jgi:hypothetical protein
MKSENDFTSILKTSVKECGVRNFEHADKLLDAFLQWFSLIPSLKRNERLQMIREIDPIWHSFVLNTKFYRNFCEKYIGHFVDHDPTDVELEEGKQEYASFTLRMLEKNFPTTINKYLYFLEEGATCCTGSGACGDIDTGGGDASNAVRFDVRLKEFV